MQYSVAVRNAKLDAIEAQIGSSAILKIWSGLKPASCALSDSGVALAIVALPADWMAAAVSGSKSMLGTWEDTSADATGTAGHFRIYDSGGTICGIQGSVGTSSADMIVDSVNFTMGQPFTVTSFTITENNG